MSSLFDWFANIRKTEAPVQKQREREIADGLWTKCDVCSSVAYTKDLQANQLVCAECDHHNRVGSSERIKQLIDANTWKPLDENIHPVDPLGFRDRKDYSQRLQDYQAKTGLTDDIGWYVGYLEQNDNAYFFATNLEAKNLQDYTLRSQVTKLCLQDLGLL